jgi:hypothetical protein
MSSLGVATMKIHWIWNPYRRTWHNGNITITDDVLRHYPFDKVAEMVYYDTNMYIKPEQFQYPTIPQADWQPKSVEEIVRILGDNSLGN